MMVSYRHKSKTVGGCCSSRSLYDKARLHTSYASCARTCTRTAHGLLCMHSACKHARPRACAQMLRMEPLPAHLKKTNAAELSTPTAARQAPALPSRQQEPPSTGSRSPHALAAGAPTFMAAGAPPLWQQVPPPLWQQVPHLYGGGDGRVVHQDDAVQQLPAHAEGLHADLRSCTHTGIGLRLGVCGPSETLRCTAGWACGSKSGATSTCSVPQTLIMPCGSGMWQQVRGHIHLFSPPNINHALWIGHVAASQGPHPLVQSPKHCDHALWIGQVAASQGPHPLVQSPKHCDHALWIGHVAASQGPHPLIHLVVI